MSSMANSAPFFLGHPRRIPQAVQLVNLRRMFPESTGTVKKGTLRWSYDFLQASPVSGVYKIEIEGRQTGKPAVWLSRGAIDEQNAKDAPHKYRVDAGGARIQICLDKTDWKPDQLYSRTYIPWTMEWIVHFEIWLMTGEWTGGGIHLTER